MSYLKLKVMNKEIKNTARTDVEMYRIAQDIAIFAASCLKGRFSESSKMDAERFGLTSEQVEKFRDFYCSSDWEVFNPHS